MLKVELPSQIHLSAWSWPEAHSQSYTGVSKEQKDKCPWVAQSEPRHKSNRKPVAWLEDCCPSTLLKQLHWAWTVLWRRMGKYCPIKVCKVDRDRSQQTHSCNCCQRCFHQVLAKGGWTLIKQRYSSFVFLINFLKFLEFVFHLEVVGYDVEKSDLMQFNSRL